MSKHQPLWIYIKNDGKRNILLTFAEIGYVLGFDIDHSFLNCNTEAEEYGYTVDKVSLKNQTVSFIKK